MNNAYRVIRRPLVTEKGTYQSEKNNVYAFEVDRKANKIQVKKAVEEIFDVKVTQVRTMLRKGKLRRRGMNIYRTPELKRALVTLKEGQRIDFV